MQGGNGNAVSIIGILLSKDNTGCGGVMMNGCEHRAEEKACQDNNLDGTREEERLVFINGDKPR